MLYVLFLIFFKKNSLKEKIGSLQVKYLANYDTNENIVE